MSDTLQQNILTRLMKKTLDNPKNGITMTGDGRLVCDSFILATNICYFLEAMDIHCYPVQLDFKKTTEICFNEHAPDVYQKHQPNSISNPTNNTWCNRQKNSNDTLVKQSTRKIITPKK